MARVPGNRLWRKHDVRFWADCQPPVSYSYSLVIACQCRAFTPPTRGSPTPPRNLCGSSCAPSPTPPPTPPPKKRCQLRGQFHSLKGPVEGQPSRGTAHSAVRDCLENLSRNRFHLVRHRPCYRPKNAGPTAGTAPIKSGSTTAKLRYDGDVFAPCIGLVLPCEFAPNLRQNLTLSPHL
jgi:hypothetical protein